MMIERAVLLHQDDDVLDIANRSGAVVCLDGCRLGDGCFERTHRQGGHSRQLQEHTAIYLAHDISVSSIAWFETQPAAPQHRAAHHRPHGTIVYRRFERMTLR